MRNFDLDQVDRLLTTTKAVRKRLDLDRPVEPEILLECLRIATYAPSAGNRQAWRWIVITDEGKREKVAELYRSGVANLGASARDGAEANEPADTARMQSSAQYLYDNAHRIPVYVLACSLGRPGPESDDIERAAHFGSIMPAVWSFQLALRSRGLGSVWTTFHLQREREMADLLGIPDSVTQAALLPVAYTLGVEFKPGSRKPVQDVTYWNYWSSDRHDDQGIANRISSET